MGHGFRSFSPCLTEPMLYAQREAKPHGRMAWRRKVIHYKEVMEEREKETLYNSQGTTSSN